MTENIIKENAESQAIDVIGDAQTTEREIFVPVKFNKQIVNLNLQEAQELAQKGMKFDVISKDYETLKSLAKAEGKSVGEYVDTLKTDSRNKRQNEILEKCGGDCEFADYVLELEKNEEETIIGLSELKENFPNIKNIEQLPQSVVEAAQMKGTNILDEYLRYLYIQDTKAKKSISSQRAAEQSALGSLSNKRGNSNPVAAEFLRGLWKK